MEHASAQREKNVTPPPLRNTGLRTCKMRSTPFKKEKVYKPNGQKTVCDSRKQLDEENAIGYINLSVQLFSRRIGADH